MHSVWRASIRFTLVTLLLLGIGYPLVVTGIAGLCFPIRLREPDSKGRTDCGVGTFSAEFYCGQIFPSRPSLRAMI